MADQIFRTGPRRPHVDSDARDVAMGIVYVVIATTVFTIVSISWWPGGFLFGVAFFPASIFAVFKGLEIDDIIASLKTLMKEREAHKKTKVAKNIVRNVYLDQKTSPFYLWLREFEDAENSPTELPPLETKDPKLDRLLKIVEKEVNQLENFPKNDIDFVASFIANDHPIVALGNDQTIRKGTKHIGYVYVRDCEWKQIVEKCCAAAAIIMIRPSINSGTQWEMSHVVKHKKLLTKTAFVVLSKRDRDILNKMGFVGVPEKTDMDIGPTYIHYPISVKDAPMIAATSIDKWGELQRHIVQSKAR